MRVEQAERVERRDAVGGCQLGHHERRLPITFGPAASQPRREIRVRDTFPTVRCVGAREPLGERRRDRLEIVVATFPDQRMLEIPQARKVTLVVLEDRLVPQERARGVTASDPVDVGETLVRLALGDGIRRRLRLAEELIDEVCRFAPLELGALAHETDERRVGAGGRSRAERPGRVAAALVRVAYGEVRERAGVADHRPCLRFPVPVAIVGYGTERALVEVAQREVVRYLLVGVGDAGRAPLGIAPRDEAGLSKRVDDELGRVVSCRAAVGDPPDHVIHVPAAERDAFGEVRSERDGRCRLMRSLEEIGAGRVVDRVLADHGFEAGERAVYGRAELVCQLVQLAREVGRRLK